MIQRDGPNFNALGKTPVATVAFIDAVHRKAFVLCLIGACFVGCGKGGPLTKEVNGKITFKGAAPPTKGKVTFAPIEPAGNYPRRPASGSFDESGAFTLTTFAKGDGIIPGRYQTNIACWREVPTLETKLSANYVPPDFKYELKIAEDADEPVEVVIDVPRLQMGK
jgi:hypothetical protein